MHAALPYLCPSNYPTLATPLSEGPSVWIHMASCLTTPTDHVRLHPLPEFVYWWVLITQFRKLYKALWNAKLRVTLINTLTYMT